MDSTHAAETTPPPVAKYHHEETPADGEKGSSVAGFSDSSEGFREEETTEGRSHLNIFCVSLGGGITRLRDTFAALPNVVMVDNMLVLTDIFIIDDSG